MTKIAIVHEWLTTYGGSEQVVAQMLKVFPDADLYTLVDFLPDEQRGFLAGKLPRTSFIQRLPMARKHYRQYLPLMPLAIEQFDLSAYDVVLTSAHAVAKGVITGPDQLHLCYCHSPIRYAWDLQHQYLTESGLDKGVKGALTRVILHYMRQWDHRTAHGVDAFAANSSFVARRIWKVYRREASVIHPPVDVDAFTCCEEKDDFYLAASRIVPYKKMELIVDAFRSMPSRKLVVIGGGPGLDDLKKRASANVSVLGYQPTEVLKRYMQRARAFVFAAEEDFGIVVVEAQACGTPVIAYGRGGVNDSVIPGETGLYFEEQTTTAIVDAVERFERSRSRFDPHTIRAHAEQFGAGRFRRELAHFVAQGQRHAIPVAPLTRGVVGRRVRPMLRDEVHSQAID